MARYGQRPENALKRASGKYTQGLLLPRCMLCTMMTFTRVRDNVSSSSCFRKDANDCCYRWEFLFLIYVYNSETLSKLRKNITPTDMSFR